VEPKELVGGESIRVAEDTKGRCRDLARPYSNRQVITSVGEGHRGRGGGKLLHERYGIDLGRDNAALLRGYVVEVVLEDFGMNRRERGGERWPEHGRRRWRLPVWAGERRVSFEIRATCTMYGGAVPAS
jgi:hypothetical protein